MGNENDPHQGKGDEAFEGLPEGDPSKIGSAEAARFAEGPGRMKRAVQAMMVIAVMAAPGCAIDKKDADLNSGPEPISDTADRTGDPEKSETEKFDEILKGCVLMPLTEPYGATTVSVRIGYTAEAPTTLKLEILDHSGGITPVDLGADGNVNPGQHMTGVVSIADIPDGKHAILTVVDPKDGKSYSKEYNLGNEIFADSSEY